MAEGVRLLLTAAAAATLASLALPLAVWTAGRTGFLDAPVGYKAHARPTPYLGGAAVVSAALAAALTFGVDLHRSWPLLLGTFALMVVGTVDDRLNLSPWLRLALEALAAFLLWEEGLGWSVFGNGTADLLLTVFWVAAVVNGFNLMDNLDGAAGSCALASAVSIAVVALLDDVLWLAVPCVALAGAVVPFLRLNLAGPARIFLGDGGSMAIGFLLAGSLMAAPMNGLEGGADFLAACLLVGVPLFDTTLVVLSRLRRGAPVFSGATDHTTHRLNAVMRSPRAVALALALVQAALAGLAISVTRLGAGPTIAAACLAGLFAVATIIAVDGARWTPLSDDS